MFSKKKNLTDKAMNSRLQELEDINCTLLFQINGLKEVIHTFVTSHHHLSQNWEGRKRWTLQEDFLHTVGGLTKVIDDLRDENQILRDDNRQLRLDNVEMTEKMQSEAGSQIFQPIDVQQQEQQKEPEQQQREPQEQQREQPQQQQEPILPLQQAIQQQQEEEQQEEQPVNVEEAETVVDVNEALDRERIAWEKVKELEEIQQQLLMDMEKEVEKRSVLEKELMIEVHKREEVEAKLRTMVNEVEAMKRKAKNNNKSPKPILKKNYDTELGVPEKLVLPEAKAPKFWLKAIVSKANGELLPLHNVLECILRPFREDEVWGLLRGLALQLHDLHGNNKSHTRVSLNSIGISREGQVVLFDVTDFPAPKFISPEHELHTSKDIQDQCDKCDIYGVGVALWSVADYLNDDDEEPKIGDDLCEFISEMTHDLPKPRPCAKKLLQRTESYESTYRTLLQHVFLEVDRKKEMRQQYEKGIVSNQRTVVGKLLEEIKCATMEQLKHSDQPSPRPAPSKLRESRTLKPIQALPLMLPKLTNSMETTETLEIMSVTQRIQMFNK